MKDARPASLTDRLRHAASEAAAAALRGVDRLIGAAAPEPALIPVRARPQRRPQ